MSGIALAIGGTALAGLYSANKAAGASARATDAASAAADQQTALSRDQFDWNKQVYQDDTRPAQQADAALKKSVVDDALARGKKQDDFADEQNAYYKSTFQPVEKKMVEEATNYDSADNVQRRSGIAAANVNQQFSNAASQKARLMGRYGLNPNSSTFGAQAGADLRAAALGAAGAATGAAFDTQDKAIALRAGASNFGRNMPNTAAAYYAGGNASGANASATSSAGLSNLIGANNTMNNAYGSYFNQTGQVGQNLSNAYQGSANAWQSAASGLGGFAGSMVNQAGGWSAIGNKFGGMFSSPGATTPSTGLFDGGIPPG